jgi:hypothetical protein
MQDNVRFMAEQLFEYVLNNHQVVTEPVGILHAFNIALVREIPTQNSYVISIKYANVL